MYTWRIYSHTASSHLAAAGFARYAPLACLLTALGLLPRCTPLQAAPLLACLPPMAAPLALAWQAG